MPVQPGQQYRVAIPLLTFEYINNSNQLLYVDLHQNDVLTINHDNQYVAPDGHEELTASSGEYNKILTTLLPTDVGMGNVVLINPGVAVGSGVAGGAGGAAAAPAARSRRSRRSRRSLRSRRC